MLENLSLQKTFAKEYVTENYCLLELKQKRLSEVFVLVVFAVGGNEKDIFLVAAAVQSRTQSPQAPWSAVGRRVKLWGNGIFSQEIVGSGLYAHA